MDLPCHLDPKKPPVRLLHRFVPDNRPSRPLMSDNEQLHQTKNPFEHGEADASNLESLARSVANIRASHHHDFMKICAKSEIVVHTFNVKAHYLHIMACALSITLHSCAHLQY